MSLVHRKCGSGDRKNILRENIHISLNKNSTYLLAHTISHRIVPRRTTQWVLTSSILLLFFILIRAESNFRSMTFIILTLIREFFAPNRFPRLRPILLAFPLFLSADFSYGCMNNRHRVNTTNVRECVLDRYD